MPSDHENCRELFALLSDYLNYELPAGACEEIKKHLEGCPPCVEFAESLRKTVELCREYQPSTMPEPISESARDQLQSAWRKVVAARAG